MASADELVVNLQGIEASTFANEVERIRARDALLAALKKVQSPWDMAWDHNWANGATNACIATLIDAGVFTKWAEAGGEPITCSELAKLTGADELLIRNVCPLAHHDARPMINPVNRTHDALLSRPTPHNRSRPRHLRAHALGLRPG
jgi:hypothetical protein